MASDLTVRLHSIENDGLPDMDDPGMVGCVAFIWDGCVVSGWPIGPEFDPGYEHRTRWEPSEDRFGGPVEGVTHWIELPRPAWSLSEERQP